MKIKYLGVASFNSKGIKFEVDSEVEVEDSIGKYLIETFKDKFKDVSPKPVAKPKPKPKAKTVKED